VRRDRLVWWFVRGGITAAVLAVVSVLSVVALYLQLDAEQSRFIAATATAEREQAEKERQAATKFGEEREADRLKSVRTKAWWQLHAGTSDMLGDLPGAYLRYASAWKSEVEAAGKDRQPEDARAFGYLVRLGTARRQQPALRGMAFQEDGEVASVAAQAADKAVAVTAGVRKVGDKAFDLVVRVWRPDETRRLKPEEHTRPLAELGAPTPPGAPIGVGGVFVAPDGGHAVVILSWDKAGGVVCPVTLPAAGGVGWLPAGSYAGSLGKAEMSPDGRHVAVAAFAFEEAASSCWPTQSKAAPVTRSTVAVWAAPEWKAVQLPGAGDHDGRAVVWATADRAAAATLYHSGTVTDAAFTPDGRGVLAVAGAAAYRWDLPAAGAYPVSLPVPGSDLDRTVADDALAPDGTAFVAGGERLGYMSNAPAVAPVGGRRGWARAWDPKTGTPLTPELLPPEPVKRVAVSPRAPWLVCTTGVEGTVRLWGPDGALVWTEKPLPEKATAVAFGDDGTALRLVVVGRQNPDGATGGTELRAYRLGATGRPDGEPQTTTYPNPFTAAVFGPRCERVAAYSKEEGEARGMVVVWDVGQGKPVPLQHDGRPAHREPVTHVGFAADGRVVSTGQDDEVVVWTPTGGKWTAEVLGVEPGKERVGHRADATGAAFDADGNRVVSAGRDGSTIVWGREPGGRYTARLTLRAGDRSREVVQAVFAGDRLVAAASADNVVRVWDTKAEASSGRLVASAPFPMAVRHVRWRADPAGLGAVLGVGRVGDSSNPAAVPDPRPWAARFTAAEFPLTRLSDAAPALALVQGAEVVAARKDLENDPTQLVGLPPGEAFAILPKAAPPPLPNEAEWHRWEAVRCEAAANWGGARWHLDRLLKESPTGRPDLYARRATVRAHLGEWDLAEADYDKAREGDGTADVLRPLALMRFRRAEAEKNPEKTRELFGTAAEAYDRLSRLGGADPHDGLRLVRAQLDAGTPAAAVESCNRLLADGFQPAELTGRFRPDVKALRAEAHEKLTPDRPQAAFADYTAAAREFQQSGLLPNAANALDRASGLKNLGAPERQELAKAYTDYADILMQRRVFVEAERAYRGVIGPGITPSPPAVRYHAAAAAVAVRYFTIASPDLAQLEGDPGYRRKALAALAALQLHRREDAAYQQACDRLFDLKGVPPADHTLTRAAAAWVSALSPRQSNERREQALASARQVVAADPLPGTHRLTLGAALARAGKTDEAVETLSKVLAADGIGPPRAEGLYQKAAGHLFLAVAYLAAERGGDAAREVEKTREAVRLLDRALDPATADADLPEDMRTAPGVAAAVWYRLELRLLLRELDAGRAE